MKCLTVQQPWAWAIVAGHKRIENRTWRTRYRGPLWIHAAARVDRGARVGEIFGDAGVCIPRVMQLGKIIGCVELVDVLPIADVAGDAWAWGPWCWIFERPRRLEKPIVCGGRLGIFDFAPAFDEPGTRLEQSIGSHRDCVPL